MSGAVRSLIYPPPPSAQATSSYPSLISYVSDGEVPGLMAGPKVGVLLTRLCFCMHKRAEGVLKLSVRL